MGFFGLIAGMALTWMAGVVWLRARCIRGKGIDWVTLAGYGYFVGVLITVAEMCLLDLLGIRFGFVSIGLALSMTIATGIWAGRGGGSRQSSAVVDSGGSEFWGPWQRWGKSQRIAFGGLLALIVLRLAGLGLEVVLRPLFPWDAWSQWATKARVWYEFGRMLPFIAAPQWLAGGAAQGFTDSAPQYPGAIPLLQVWASDCIGRWDDALMNLPWLLCALALGLAFYGQARRWPVPPWLAMMFTYFLLSLPVLDTHVALAGYADLFMGAFYGLAAMAFFQWVRTRERWQGTVALALAFGCAFVKTPGIVWMLTFLPALWVVAAPRSGRIGLAALAVAGLLVLASGELDNVSLLGYTVLRVPSGPVWEALRDNLLAMDNWHLLWVLVLAGMGLSLPRLFSSELRGMTVLVLAGISFLTVVFFFTKAQMWAEDYTTLNRALLHIAPMLVFYVMVLFQEAVRLPRWIAAPSA